MIAWLEAGDDRTPLVIVVILVDAELSSCDEGNLPFALRNLKATIVLAGCCCLFEQHPSFVVVVLCFEIARSQYPKTLVYFVEF